MVTRTSPRKDVSRGAAQGATGGTFFLTFFRAYWGFFSAVFLRGTFRIIAFLLVGLVTLAFIGIGVMLLRQAHALPKDPSREDGVRGRSIVRGFGIIFGLEIALIALARGHANTCNGDGLLSTTPPVSEVPDSYTYDPGRPVPTHGGAHLLAPDFINGPLDQRALEQREDLLVYSTPPLEHDVEVTGPIKVHIWAVSSASDTDFVARLVDVFPDGTAFNLTDGIIRARYRSSAGGEEPTLIEPGTAYAYEIDLWTTSNVFKKGHRIRLDITSSNFPRWDRNPNTGHELEADAELVVAQQTILHDAEHPSALVLPVVPLA